MSDLANVVIGAVVGVLGSIAVQTYFGMHSARIALVNDFLKDLGEIEQLAVQYWLETTTLQDGAHERRAMAAKLRGKLHATRLFKKHAKKMLREEYGRFDELDRELFRSATGGDFESLDAKPSFEQAGRVMLAAAELRSVLRGSRWTAYWAH